MLRASIDRARERLDRADRAILDMIAAGSARDRDHVDIPAQRAAWSNFLAAFNGIYIVLKAGAKGHPPSEQFVAKHLNQRKNDLLLAYLEAARHEEEHGLSDIAPAGVNISVRGTLAGGMSMIGGQMHINHDPRADPITVEQRPRLKFVNIIGGRSGKTYYLPMGFLGVPLVSRTPSFIAGSATGHVRHIVDEAEKLVHD